MGSYFLVTNAASLHAFLLDNSGTLTDLNPFQFFPGIYLVSRALGVRNGQQVGYGTPTFYPNEEVPAYQDGQALLLTGSAASAVVLHPLGYASSRALATNGSEPAGWATDAATLNRHAVLWSNMDRIGPPTAALIGAPGLPTITAPAGTAGIAIDLHPAVYTDSRVTAVNDNQQVGDGWVGVPGAAGSVRHALVWSGIGSSVVDLNRFLPPGFTHAVATGIDGSGNIVGYAYNTPVVPPAAMPADAIAVMFTPAPIPAVSVSSLVLSPRFPAPGSVVQGMASLNGPAPAGGLLLNFVSSDPALLAVPASLVIAEGQTSVTFSVIAGGATLAVPTIAKLLVSDGAVSRSGGSVVTPPVNIASVAVAAAEGGLLTTGTVSLKIPAQFGGSVVYVVFSSPSIAMLTDSLTNSVVVPQGATSVNFRVTAMPVTAVTNVTVTANLNGQSVTGVLIVNPPPPIALTSLTIPQVVGGQSVTGAITVDNYPRSASGAVILLTSGDTRTLQVPASVTIPRGATSVTFPVTTSIVTGPKGVSVKAVYGASNLTTTVTVIPIPAVNIIQADYVTDTHVLKVAATTPSLNAILTYGIDPAAPPLGTMSLDLGQYSASATLATAPSFVSVWSSDGGKATVPVTQKLSTGGGGGGSGSFKLTVNKAGKGVVTSNPSGIGCGASGGGCSLAFLNGVSVTLTAVPDPGATWIGWGGGCSGTSMVCTVVMTSDRSVSATFK